MTKEANNLSLIRTVFVDMFTMKKVDMFTMKGMQGNSQAVLAVINVEMELELFRQLVSFYLILDLSTYYTCFPLTPWMDSYGTGKVQFRHFSGLSTRELAQSA